MFLIRADRERADRDHMTIAVTLDAIAERRIDRGLLVGRLQPKPRPPPRADYNRAMKSSVTCR